MAQGWIVCVGAFSVKPDVCAETLSLSGSCGAAFVDDVGVDACANVSEVTWADLTM